MPRISIIIPCKNSQQTLIRTLSNLLLLSRIVDIEVLVIDNGSTDASRQIASEWSSKFSNFVLQSHDWSDVSKARNIGINLARSEYITWLDADDEVEVELAPQLVHTMEAENLDYIRCDGRHIFPDSTRKWAPHRTVRNRVFRPRDYPDFFDFPLTGSGLYSRKFLQNIELFPEGVRTAEVRHFVWSTGLNAARVMYIPKTFYLYYRDSSESTTLTPGGHHLDIFLSFEKIKNDYFERIRNQGLEIVFWRQYFHLLQHNFNMKNRLDYAQKAALQRKSAKLWAGIPSGLRTNIWFSSGWMTKVFLLKIHKYR